MDGGLSDSRIGQTIDRYRIESLLGKGGMGVVYLAEDTRLHRKVAIKFAVLPDSSASDSASARAEFLARFEREARLAASLSHPNIATVHDSGVTPDGQPYLVMEYIRGRSLQAALQVGELSLPARLDVIAAIASALAAAHSKGVLHRDIKPANILLNENGQPKVLDFGLAKQLVPTNAELDEYAQTQASSITRRHTLLGTPHFMSPEQIEHSGDDARLDGRSDLYSLGVILYQCLTSQLPFTGKETMNVIAQVLRDKPTPPAQLNAQVTPELNTIAIKLLAKAREDRYATAAELLEALQSARAALPETSSPAVTHSLPNQVAASLSGPSASSVSPASVTIRLPSKRTAWRAGAVIIALLAALALWWRWAHDPGYQPSPEVASLYQKGIEALHDGAYLAAERCFTEATKADANFALAGARRAEAQFEMDLQGAANDSFLRAANNAQQLNRTQRLELEAIRLTLLREHTQATEHWQKNSTLVNAPERLAALLDLGRAHDRASQTDAALAVYRQASALDPQSAAVNLRLGILLGRKKDPAAESALQRAESEYQNLGKLEGEATVSYWRGVRLQFQRDFSKARAALQTALAKSQTLNNRYRYLQTLIQIGSLENEAGQTATAIQTLQTAERESLANVTLADWARINLAICYQIKQQPAEAEALYRRVIASTTEHITPYNQALARVNYASFLLQQKRRDEASEPARAAYSFFQNGQYQDELMRSARLLARLLREQLKLDDALQILQKPLQLTRTNQEASNVALLLLEQARIEALRGNLPLALQHLAESRKQKSEGPAPYDLLDQAKTAWRAGDYAQFNQALSALQQLPNLPADYPLRMALLKAEAALSQRDHSAALNYVTPALASSDAATRTLAQLLQNYAQSLSGTPRAKLPNVIRGKDLNQLLQEQDLDFQITALWYSAITALATQDGQAARPPLEQLTSIAAQLGNPELQWRVAGLNARLSQQTGDAARASQQATQARSALVQLRQLWDEPSYQRYLSRPDLQQLNEQLH